MTQDRPTSPSAPGAWRTDTAERPPLLLDDRTRSIAAVAAPPEPADRPAGLPLPTRWPLYADQPDRSTPATTGGPATPSVPLRSGRGRTIVPWVAVAATVAVVGGGLAAAVADPPPVLVSSVVGDPGLGVRPGSEVEAATDDARAEGASRDAARSGGGDASGDARDRRGSSDAARRDLRARASSVVSGTRASAPVTASPNQDLSGQRVGYGAANLLDGRPETTWRMPGNGRDTVLTLRLARPTDITTVGLINGYAKTGSAGERSIDWYDANRRVGKVEWFFDDGSRVVQVLGETRELQTIDIRPRTTSTVRMRISRVSMPGPGPDGRDFTAVSEISLAGVAAP